MKPHKNKIAKNHVELFVTHQIQLEQRCIHQQLLAVFIYLE